MDDIKTAVRPATGSPRSGDTDNLEMLEPSGVAAVVGGDYSGVTLNRPRLIVDVNLIIVRDGLILLGRRCNTDFGNGCYNPPAGHLELGESVVDAAIREAKEELNIDISPSDVRFAQVLHNSYGVGRIAFFFEVAKWSGVVTNMEPHKCEDLAWFSLDSLPDRIMPHIRTALEGYRASDPFRLYGW